MNSKLLFLYSIVVNFFPETRLFALKRVLLRLAGVKVGNNVRICSSVKILGDGDLYIGDNTWIGSETIIVSSSPSKIDISHNVDIGPSVSISNGSHEIGTANQRAGKGITGDITIKPGVWIGMRSNIILGVTVGRSTIIGSGSNVISSLQENSLCVGNPCIKIKELSSGEKTYV